MPKSKEPAEITDIYYLAEDLKGVIQRHPLALRLLPEIASAVANARDKSYREFIGRRRTSETPKGY